MGDVATEARSRIGLIVNPIAGMGGRVGLKGSDGKDILRKARELGAVQTSPGKASDALRSLLPLKDRIEIIAYPSEMGEDEAKEAGFEPTVIGKIWKGHTDSKDTKKAAIEMARMGVDLMLFSGGDGTARDICDAIDQKVNVIGIPAGVKMHSGVFAINPTIAGNLALWSLQGKPVEIREMEVMDIDEKAFRRNRLSAKLYGYMKVPYMKTMIQSSKAGSAPDEDASLDSIAAYIAEGLDNDTAYVMGAGTTIRRIMEELGLRKTLLGVDVVQGGKVVGADVNERQLLSLLKGRKAKIIVGVIGGQGFVFGRGNQQISPEVIRMVGKDNIVVVATPGKLASLSGSPLLADTGDGEVDRMLDGYIKVVTGYGKRTLYRIRSG
jgi:predicted polyphosphate/ATP-dependent NAD kinase